MAERKPDLSKREEKSNAQGQSGRMTESSPNPHGQAKVIQMPHPDQRQPMKKNVAQTTSTVDRVNPSVTGPLEQGHEGLSDDSMFNSADPQVRNMNPVQPGVEGTGKPGRKKNKDRKIV